MSRDPFRPLTINNKTVSWFTVSGRTKSLRRYFETQVIISGSHKVPEMTDTQQVTEVWIKDSTGKETPVALRFDLMLAVGQRVSAVRSIIKGRPESAWLVLVNHDAESSHYLQQPRSFLRNAGVFYFLARWLLYALLGVGLVAYCYFWRSPNINDGPFDPLWTVSLWPWLALCLVPAAAVGAFIGWQSLRVRRAWKEVEAVVDDMVDSLLDKTGEIDWTEPKEVSVLPKAQEAAKPGHADGTIQAAASGDSGRTSDFS